MFKKPELVLLNPLTTESRSTRVFPFEVGNGDGCDLRTDNNGHAEGEGACVFQLTGSVVSLRPRKETESVRLDGSIVTEPIYLELNRDYALQVDVTAFLFRITKKPEQWLKGINCDNWRIYTLSDSNEEIIAAADLEFTVASRGAGQGEMAFVPSGADIGFFLEHLREIFGGGNASELAAASDYQTAAIHTGAGSASADEGELTCPSCWLHFDHGSVMSIAHHDDLRGDPILGADAKLRFYPNQFDGKGRPLDAMNVPCTDTACPHCRRKLPPHFLDLTHHIFSIVGAPSAGKSYYLCVLLHELPRMLFRKFGVAFMDGDPARNARLNEMKNQLFSAQKREEAFVGKTDFEGVMYEQLPRYGKTVALPRPFVFNLRKGNEPDGTCALIFYDNAGEHFKPNVSMEDSPGALHVASSEAIFFLYDPTSNPSFRARLRDQEDPQLKLSSFDEQESILAEMSVRIKAILACDTRTMLETPLAIMVGKCDVWQHLLPEPFATPVGDGTLDLEAVEKNSAAIREFLIDLVPEIVANAESISTHVLYFPVSAFGHSPEPITDGPLKGRLAPDPSRLAPIMVETPLLWAISRLQSSFVPTRKAELGVASPVAD